MTSAFGMSKLLNIVVFLCGLMTVFEAATVELQFGQRIRPLRKSLDLLGDSRPVYRRRKMPRQNNAFLNNPFLSPITNPIGSLTQNVFRPNQLMVNVNVPFVGNPFLTPLLGGQTASTSKKPFTTNTTTKRPSLAPNPFPSNPFLNSKAPPTTTTKTSSSSVATPTTTTTSVPMKTLATTTKASRPDPDNIYFFGDYSTPDTKKATTTTSTTPIPQSEIENIFFFGDAPTTSTKSPGGNDANKIVIGAFDFANYVPVVSSTTVKPAKVNLTDEALNSFFEFSNEVDTTTNTDATDDETTTSLLDDRINPNVIKSLVG